MPTKFKRSYKLTWTPSGVTRRVATPGGERVYKRGSQAITALANGLSLIPEGVQEQATSVITEYTKKHNEDAQALAPKDTGFMDSTFEWDVTGAGGKVVGTSRVTALYAAFQEFGFHHWRSGTFVRPKPFMFPAYAALKGGFMKAIKGLLG